MLFAKGKGQATAICLRTCNLKDFDQVSEDEVEVVRRVPELSRRRCREAFGHSHSYRPKLRAGL